MNFETDLDYELLDTLDEEQLVGYIRDNFVSPNIPYDGEFSFKKCYKLMKQICKIMNITPSPEQWVFLLADCERLLCEACAGAGKTTMAQLRSIKEKIIHRVKGENILALAYNKHAVDDMKSRHSEIIRKINSLGLPQLHRDVNISCTTFHAFCKAWVGDYLEDFKITNKNDYILTEAERCSAMDKAINAYNTKNKTSLYSSDVLIHDLLAVYSYTRETHTQDDPQAWNLCSSISGLKALSLEQIAQIFMFYERWKSLKHKLEFSDLVDNMYTLCCRPEVMQRIRANYKVFILDEYQDFTPAMLRVIRIILEGDQEHGIEPYTEARLTCIGDGDQSIYGFRGTDSDNCIKFKDTFSTPGLMCKITAMSENRRCPTEVIEYARKVIESNQMRINKPVRAIKSGGRVTATNYASIDDEISILIQKLKQMSEKELSNSCICYRNQSSSLMLTLRLAEAGIPFKVRKGFMPLSDRLSQSLFDILNMLSYPDVPAYASKALYKVVPGHQREIEEVIAAEKDPKLGIWDSKCFYELNFPMKLRTMSGFSDALQMLERARKLHRNSKPMETYLPDIIYSLRKYYLDWMQTKSDQLTPAYIEYVTKWFSRPISYEEFTKQHRKLLADIDSTKRGINLTTMHGLKGLEYDNVFIVDMSDAIFPGTELSQSDKLSPQQKDVLECEARRLFYVALTRTKNNLDIFFDAENPSRYYRFFTQNTGIAAVYQKFMKEEDGYLVSDIQSSAEPALNTDIDSLLADCGEEEDIDFLGLPELPAPHASSTSIFSSLLREEEEREERIKTAIGEKNFEAVRGKGVLSRIIDRVITEEKTG